MPKNAVPRLQKIENNIKSVISIYEVVKNCQDNDTIEKPRREESLHLPQTIPSKSLEGSNLSDRKENKSNLQETLDSLIKPIDVVNQSCQSVLTGTSMFESNKWILKKPGSAPSSISALSTTCESNFIRKLSSSSANKVFEKLSISKAKTSASLNQSKVGNLLEGELPMTPSKTLQTADRILKKNNFNPAEDDNEDLKPALVETEKQEDFRTSKVQHTEDVKTNVALKENSIPDIEKMKKELKNLDMVADKSRPPFPRKKNKNEIPEWLTTIKPKSSGGGKPCTNTKNEKSIPKPLRNITQEKIFKPDIGSPEGKMNGVEKCKIDQRGRTLNDNQDFGCELKSSKEARSNLSEKIVLMTKEIKLESDGVNVKKSIKELEKEKKVKCSPFESLGLQNPAEYENEELWMKELSKIIEKSNQKLEKMKVSKEQALEIAKHLKNKYEEIQQSKQELMEKVQKIEKDNERLNNELRDAQESKMMWQLKFIELEKNPQTKLPDQNADTKDLLEENASLKTKLNELQKRCTEEIFEKQKEIDRIQTKRLEEMKQEINNRKSRAEVLKLKSENSELISKNEALQILLNESHVQIKTQEEKIRQFEEEVQGQKQHLKEKTQRLEETNKELELIRKNYNDLEEQVKTLRKNFETFDEMQKDLMKQLKEYEQQINTKQNEMKTLQDENSKLKTDLENEKDALLIKIKIIEDQQATIKQLREKSEEAKTLLKRNQSLERVLNIEREEKLELQEAVERLKWRKEELKKKIKSLEQDLFLAPQEVVRDLQKTQIVLHELENQVQKKQKEWEIQMHFLTKEKEQACSVAEFATKKLMQTTNEYQKQSEAHKKLRRILAENLAEKEKILHEANGKQRKV